MKNIQFYFLIVLSITLHRLLAQTTAPEWFLNPVSDENYYYGIGISDLNGSVEERRAQSLKRALINLALLRECTIKSMDKSYFTDVSEAIEVVVKINNQALFNIDDIEISRRWREEDGHVYTEVKFQRSNIPDNQNAIAIKYYYSDVTDKYGTDNITLSLQMSAKWPQDRLWESVEKSPGESYSYDNIYVEYAPEFKQCFGESQQPDWYLKVKSDKNSLDASGYGKNANLHVAVILSYINAIKELSIKMGERERELAETYGITDENQDPYAVASTINTKELRNIIPKKISIGISDDRNFIVYTWLLIHL